MSFLSNFDDPERKPEQPAPRGVNEDRVFDASRSVLGAELAKRAGVKPLREIDGPHPDAIEPEAAADYSPEERQRYRDLFARAEGGSEGDPNYEQRAQEFDRRAIAAVGLGAYAEHNPVSIMSLIPPRPTGQGEVRSASTSDSQASPEGDSQPDPVRRPLPPVAASPPESSAIAPRRPNGKRPYQRIPTAGLAEIATVGGLASALGEGVPDPGGVGAELAWRHKPAAHRIAAALGCSAGTRSYPGSSRG